MAGGAPNLHAFGQPWRVTRHGRTNYVPPGERSLGEGQE